MKEPVNLCKFYVNDGTTRLWCKFYDQCSSDNILSQGHLVVVSVRCDIRQRLGHFFRNEQIFQEGTIDFCKFCDSEGATRLLLRSDHFISSTV